MLKELSLNNFLSYKDETMSFPKNATVAVVGKNGHGKSSMLEAIPFVLYGSGRTNLSGMVRLKSNNGMKVRLVLSDVPKTGSEMVVERGVKPGGGGYTKVWVDSVLMAKGGASSGNNKAQDFINNALGVDEDTFFLTSFFGMGANDRLMQVKPSERLETMQSLAKVNICNAFHVSAKEKIKDLESSIEIKKATVENMRTDLDDSEVLGKNLEKIREDLSQAQEQKEDLYAVRNSLLKYEDRYRKLVASKETISTSINELKRSIVKTSRRIVDLKSEYSELKDESKELIKRRGELEDTINSSQSLDYLKEVIDNLTNNRAVLSNMVKLKSDALSNDVDGTCPVCDSKLSEHSKEDWAADVDRMKAEIKNIDVDINRHKDMMLQLESATYEMSKVKMRIEFSMKEEDRIVQTGKEWKKDLQVYKADLKKLETKFLNIEEELVSFSSEVDKLHKCDSDLEDIHSMIGALEQKIIIAKEKIESDKAKRKTIRGFERELKAWNKELQALNLVKEAFSRYAIPVQLLRAIREAIEKRASRIYREFSNGRISIIDTEGARPGIEFVLEDETGQRAYKVLSMGEKVMMFIAVRIALTDIVNSSVNNRIQFLILDEVTGNLDPDMRNSLTSLINKLLRTYFPQVFMVSHVTLRDIFTRTFHVEKTNGVSHVQVI